MCGATLAVCGYHLGYTLARGKYRCVVGTGLAGTYDAQLLGKAVLVKKDVLKNVGIEGEEWVLDGRWNTAPVPQQIESAIAICKSLLPPDIERVICITVPQTKRSPPPFLPKTIETLEGWAMAYACRAAGVPFLHLRLVVNLVGKEVDISAVNPHWLSHLLNERLLPHLQHYI